MERLKSTAKDLRDLFESSISAQHIAEHLVSFDEYTDASRVREFMAKCHFDVVGLRRGGLVEGYVKETELTDGSLADHPIIFSSSDSIIDASDSLLDTFRALREGPRLFVRVFGHVGGIITRGDLQKAPVRMWLFGLIGLVEMQLLRIIRRRFPEDTWRPCISDCRWRKAEKLRNERKQENEDIDTADCLEFCDKRVIIGKTADIRQKLEYKSAGAWETDLEALEDLRNDLAHAQAIKSGSWPELMALAEKAEALLCKCEELGVH